MKRKGQGVLAVLLAALCLAASAVGETVTGDPEARFRADEITYQDKAYRPKRRLTSILLLGVDQRAEDTAAFSRYRHGGQADFLVLLVIDDNADTITPIQIDRDTITEITTLTVFGQASGAWAAQICLAHGFGDGGALSCELTADAVSRYLQNAPVDGYAALNLDGIAVLNDALGGVTVTLRDDFSAYDPTMTPGQTLRLQGVQAEYYVRTRYDVGDQTNASRAVRQRAYIAAAAVILRDRLAQSVNYMGTLYDAMEAYIVTDMSRGRMINLANRARQYELLDTVTIQGEYRLGESGYVEFYPDEASRMKAVLDVFYDPVP